MVRLHIGDCHVRALINDEDVKNKYSNLESYTPTLTNATPFAFWKPICQGLLYISNIQGFKGATGKNAHPKHHGASDNQKKNSGATFGKPSGPPTVGQGLDWGSQRLMSVSVDSGAEIVVWPQERAPRDAHRGVRGESLRRKVLRPWGQEQVSV